MEEYEMGYLRDIFDEHGKEFMNSPNFNSDDFNLPVALKSMVEEIIRLRHKISELEEDVKGWK